MFLNKIILATLSPSYSKAILNALKYQYVNTEESIRISNKKLKNILEYAVNYTDYYQQSILKIKSNQIQPSLDMFPILTKELINNHSTELISRQFINKSRMKKNSTSGSTGVKLNFFSDKKTDVIRHACSFRSNTWTGWDFGEPQVILWGAIHDFKKLNSLKKKILNSRILFNSSMLSSYDMTTKNMMEYIEIINKFKPTIITAYPSSLELFANFIMKNNYQIHSPKGIITSGETLFPFQREKIQDVFRCQVHNRYGCREVGHIACECEQQNGLHISSDHVYVEVVNKEGRPCKPGEVGEILITDLDNFVFPFIRYKIGDIGALSEKRCNCGRSLPLLEKIEGRTFDIIVGQNGNHLPGTFFTLLKYKVNGLEQFQIFQEQVDKIKVIVKRCKEFDDIQQKILINCIKEKLGDNTIVEIEQVDKIEVKESGKFHWVTSKIATSVKL